jgi:hypothetical protein
MNSKIISLRVPDELHLDLCKSVSHSKDQTGYKTLSMNTWILIAIKDKIQRDKKNAN